MSKYSQQFKLKVVQQYLTGSIGFHALAQEHGLRHSMIQRWVGFFRHHGLDGLRKKSSQYDASFKLSVLQHMWANELSHGETAVQFNIRHPAAVGMWERCYHAGGIDALISRPRGRPKTMPSPIDKPSSPVPEESERTREELVAEVNQLRMEVAYLKKLRALVQSQAQQRPTTRKKRK